MAGAFWCGCYLCNNSGSSAMFAAIFRASSRVISLVAARRPSSPSK
jgi:hypothetical protein